MARFVRKTLLTFKTVEGNGPALTALSVATSTNMNVEQGAQFNRAEFSEEAIFSNVGPVPYGSDFGKVTINYMWAPVMLRGHEPEQTIGVATINGSLHLVHTSSSPIPGLLESVEQKLTQACHPIVFEDETISPTQCSSSAGGLAGCFVNTAAAKQTGLRGLVGLD